MTGDRSLRDTLGRPLSNLRLSVTDRCNLRCAYCMPEREYVWLPRAEILTLEEIARLFDVFLALGVTRARLTGGEPLLRRDLPTLVGLLREKPGLQDLAMTTNGVLLAEAARPLREAGLHRVTISLDTLQPARFETLTRTANLNRVLAGIDAAAAEGFASVKLDTVVIRGVNDDEIVPLLEYARRQGAELRYIEYMDVGGATGWTPEKVFSRTDMLRVLESRYGPIAPVQENSAAPAERFRLPDGTVFGIIASTTAPFCRSCDRSRLTADGLWYLCLYAARGTDLRGPLRAGASTEELAALITDNWRRRDDRGAEVRLALRDRAPLVGIEKLREDPHLEMHTRGG